MRFGAIGCFLGSIVDEMFINYRSERYIMMLYTWYHLGPNYFYEAIARSLAIAESHQECCLADCSERIDLVFVQPDKASQRRGAKASRSDVPNASMAKVGCRLPIVDRVMLGERIHIPGTKVIVSAIRIPSANRATTAAQYAATLYRLFAESAKALLRRERWPLKSAIVRLTARGVQVGDLVASTHLRLTPLATGELRLSRTVLKDLTRARHLVRAFAGLGLNRCCFATTPELTYIHALLPRVLETRGARSLLPDGEGRLQAKSSVLSQIPASTFEARPAVQLERDELQGRGGSLSASLTIIEARFKALQEHSLAIDRQQLQQLVRANKPQRDVAVIFLHDFGDGQFFHGIDEPYDLFTWTRQTIRALIDTTDARIFIKPHIVRRESKHRLNSAAITRLRLEFQDEGRVSWVPPDVTVVNLHECLSNIAWFGITHHGTVAEDLSFLGVPVVASVVGPWGTEFKFAWTYKSWNDYLKLLTTGAKLGLPPDVRTELSEYLEHRYRSYGAWRADASGFFNRVCELRLEHEVCTDGSTWFCAQGVLGGVEILSVTLVDALNEYAKSIIA